MLPTETPRADPVLEQRFFDLFSAYYDLESRPNRRYGTGEYRPDRMQPLARLMGHPENDLQIIHVAGTKGKGTTSFFLASILTAAGEKTGVFSSPHFRTVRERFRTGFGFVSYEQLLDRSRELLEAIEKSRLHPTLFEIMTILALLIFRESQCRYAVLETGIGGLLDATNFIGEKRLTIITPISYDHMELLGNHIRDIAAQKAGILRPGTPLVCAPQPFPEAMEVIRERARSLGIPLVTVSMRGPLPKPFRKWSLPRFLRDNARTALTAAGVMGIRPVWKHVRLPSMPGRFEIVRSQPPVVLDAAHNGDSARRLAQALRETFPGTLFTVVVGIAPGKDAEGILRRLRPVARDWILTHPDSPRGSDLDGLKQAARKLRLPVRVLPRIQCRDQLPLNRPLLFTGSFFTALIGDRLFASGPGRLQNAAPPDHG